jgi:hypothetical protein
MPPSIVRSTRRRRSSPISLTGAMGHLQRLVDRFDEVGVEWRQDLPDVCTPIRRGQPTSSYELIEV